MEIEELRELVTNQKNQITENKNTIEALQDKANQDKLTIEELNKQITDLKVKNHDLFLKVVQEPIQQQTQQTQQIQQEPVMSVADLTYKLLNY